MANYAGQRTTATPLAPRITNYDPSNIFNPEIAKGKPIEAKFMRLYGMTKKVAPVKDVKYRNLEDTYSKQQVAIATLPGGATGTTLTVAAADIKLFRTNTILYNMATTERYLVTGVNYGSATVTVTRDYGTVLSGASAATAATDMLVLDIGADSEGGGAPDSVSGDTAESYNYISNIRTPFNMSMHEKNTEHEVVKDPWAFLANKKKLEHLFKLEKTIWFSARGTGTDVNGKPYTTTGGLMQHIKRILDIGSTTAYGGVLTERLMDYIMELAFVNGNDTKDAFCGRHFLTALSGFAKNRLVFNSQETKRLGMNVSEYTHGGNLLRLIQHPKLFVGTGATSGVTGGTMASKLVIVDMEYVSLTEMRNMGTSLTQNIQNPDVWGREDEWKTTIGLRMSPGLDNTYNAASGVPEQYESPHLIVDGFDSY